MPDKIETKHVVSGGAILIVVAGLGSIFVLSEKADTWMDRQLAPVVDQHHEDTERQAGRDDGQDARIQGLIGTLNTLRAELEKMREDSAKKRNDIEDEWATRVERLLLQESDTLQRIARLEAKCGID